MYNSKAAKLRLLLTRVTERFVRDADCSVHPDKSLSLALDIKRWNVAVSRNVLNEFLRRRLAYVAFIDDVPKTTCQAIYCSANRNSFCDLLVP